MKAAQSTEMSTARGENKTALQLLRNEEYYNCSAPDCVDYGLAPKMFGPASTSLTRAQFLKQGIRCQACVLKMKDWSSMLPLPRALQLHENTWRGQEDRRRRDEQRKADDQAKRNKFDLTVRKNNEDGHRNWANKNDLEAYARAYSQQPYYEDLAVAREKGAFQVPLRRHISASRPPRLGSLDSTRDGSGQAGAGSDTATIDCGVRGITCRNGDGGATFTINCCAPGTAAVGFLNVKGEVVGICDAVGRAFNAAAEELIADDRDESRLRWSRDVDVAIRHAGRQQDAEEQPVTVGRRRRMLTRVGGWR